MPLIPIPDDWDGETWQCYVIEWPDSERWRAIFLGQLTAPSKGRFWDERTGTITTVQETGLEIYKRNILGGIMSCFDDLALSVRYLADRLYSKPCCPSSVNLNVVQTVTTGGNTVYGTEEPGGIEGEPGEGTPPTGYETWDEYYTKKCQAANLVADGLISFYGNLGSISVGSAAVIGTAIGLAIPGIIAVPPAVIPLLVAALLGLGVSITVLTSIGGWLSDNRADLVCLLYESDTVALAVDAFAALIDEALIALAIGSSLHPYVKAVALGMASTDTLNQLFDANLGITYAGADCSECEGECNELLGDWVLESTASPTEDPPYVHYVDVKESLKRDHGFGDWIDDCEITGEVLSYSGATFLLTAANFSETNCAGAVTNRCHPDDLPDGVCVASVLQEADNKNYAFKRSSTSFTVTFRIDGAISC